MASFRSIQAFLLFTTLLINLSTAIYEDQVGKFDWRRSLIGNVKHAKFDNKRLFVTTHDNVVASLSLKNDQIIWRQLLESPSEQQPQFLHLDRDLITVSGNPRDFHVRGWDPATGSVLWEWAGVTERDIDPFWLISGEFLLHVVPIEASHLEVTQYIFKTGEINGNTRKIGAPWIGRRCATANPYFVCITNGQLFWVDVVDENSKTNSHSIQALLGEPDSGHLQLIEFSAPKPSILAVRSTNARLVEIEGGSIKAKHNLSPNAICVENTIYQLEANLANPDKLIKVKAVDLISGQERISVDVDYPLGLGGPYIVGGYCTGALCHLLLSSTDNAVTLVRMPEGKVIWSREEALSDIVAVEFFELPASELDVSIENEFKTNSNDVISMLLHRISSQGKQLYNLILPSQLLSNNALVRDDFGLHKIVVVATGVGKLFGIDTLTGSIVWTYRLPNVKAFNHVTMKLLVQRTARYAPLPAQCVLLAEDINTGNGIVFRFDPIRGTSSRDIERLNYKIKQALPLPNEDNNHLKQILVIAADNSVHLYPEDTQPIVQNDAENTYIYSIESSLLKGFKLGPNLNLGQVWEVNLGPAQLVGVSTRPAAERVHSQGRVKSDRSVYYKYVNPNLIAIAALNDDPVHKHVLSVYLIDGVTGLVLYSTSHKRCKGPVHVVHSENWLVYTFFNERFRRHEVVAAELYEGNVQLNQTAFSSFGVSQLPQIYSQSYILPATPLSMTVTLTERGITNKFLLVALSSGGVVEIPWMLLQPRFDDSPCGPEESCIPYMPEIPIPHEAVINYNQTLARIRGIEVAPARLESTSHVLIHGLDLFYTRVAPSKTFDVLKEDFDHKLIILVLSGLVVASFVTKHLAAKKALRQAWK